jgi:hypothetical protein
MGHERESCVETPRTETPEKLGLVQREKGKEEGMNTKIFAMVKRTR